MGVGRQRHSTVALPRGKTRYRRLGGPQGRKISPPTGIRSPNRPARSESLHRLSYPGPVDTGLENKKKCIDRNITKITYRRFQEAEKKNVKRSVYWIRKGDRAIKRPYLRKEMNITGWTRDLKLPVLCNSGLRSPPRIIAKSEGDQQNVCINKQISKVVFDCKFIHTFCCLQRTQQGWINWKL